MKLTGGWVVIRGSFVLGVLVCMVISTVVAQFISYKKGQCLWGPCAMCIPNNMA